MESVFTQIGPWIFFLTLGSGMGIPLGIPPGPDDPVMARLAPQECVFYTTWAASAVANPSSKNQAEQMLAEPEVRQFVEHLEKWIRHALNQPGSDREANNLSDATLDAMLMIVRHQTTLFVSDVKIKEKKVTAKGGMVVALGTDAPMATRLFHQNVRSFFLNLNVESVEDFRIEGQKWYRVKPKAEFPTMIVGIKDSYLIVAVGEGSLDLILKRMQEPAPEWLANARRIAAFERPTGLTYINLQRLREVGPASTDIRRKKWIELLGLAQSPWLVSASGLIGPDVVTRTVLPLEGQPRGLLLPASDRGLTREDLASIPEDASVALAVRLNAHKTLDALVKDADKTDPEIKRSLSKALEFLKHGGEPDSRQEDVFASLGDRWNFYNSPQEGGLVMTGLTGIVPITDRKQFSRNYEVLTRLVTQCLPIDDSLGSGGSRIHRVRFGGNEIHYANLGEVGLAPAWCADEHQLVAALAPQNIKAYLSRGGGRSLAEVPDIARELSGGDPLLAVGYLDAPRVFESVYPLLIIAAPSYMGANGLVEGRRDMSMIPSLPSVRRHLRPGVATLRRTKVGLELTSRGSLPGFGLAAPVMFMVWDSEWLNLVFGESENNAPPVPVVPAAGPAVPIAPPGPVLPPALPPPVPAR